MVLERVLKRYPLADTESLHRVFEAAASSSEPKLKVDRLYEKNPALFKDGVALKDVLTTALQKGTAAGVEVGCHFKIYRVEIAYTVCL